MKKTILSLALFVFAAPVFADTFTLTANPATIQLGQISQILASGGEEGPYTYEIDPSSTPGPKSPFSGSISPITGVYTAPSNLGGLTSEVVTIRATDTAGDFVTVAVTVMDSPFLVTATPSTIQPEMVSRITASGGFGPYTFEIDPASAPGPLSPYAGHLDPTTGFYTASSTVEGSGVVVTIRATDTTGSWSTTRVKVLPGLR